MQTSGQLTWPNRYESDAMTNSTPLRNDRDDGFTLIELLVVIVILGVLATVVVFAVGGITDRGSNSAEAADEKTLVTAQEAHQAQFGTYTDEAGLVSAGLLRDQSELHDISLAIDSSSYEVVYAGSGGNGGGGGNGGASAQTLGTFDAIVYNQGGSPVVAVFSQDNMAASLASITGSFAGEIVWFNDADLDTAAEMATALAAVADTGVLASATDGGWDVGNAADAYGIGTIVDGWSYSGDVEGLVDFGTNGTIEGADVYNAEATRTFGNGPLQVALFPENLGDVAGFEAFVAAGRSVQGATLNLMPVGMTDLFMDGAVGDFDFTFVGDFSGTYPLLELTLTANHGPIGGAWNLWFNGELDLEDFALDQANVLI
jgi:prepilin-type N-terminal cleavage/methylation domain-containing protein